MGETGCQRTVYPLLVQLDQAMLRIEVFRCQGAAAAAGGLDVQPEKNSVQSRVIPGARGGAEDFF